MSSRHSGYWNGDGIMSSIHQTPGKPSARVRRSVVMLVATMVFATAGVGTLTAAEAHTYATPDMSCMEAQFEFAGPVRPTRCKSMTLAVAQPHSASPRFYAGRLRNAFWRSWTHAKAIGRGQVQTHRQGWVDIRIKLSRPRRATYNLEPKWHRWTYTQFRFKYFGHSSSRWLKYEWAECDSFSDVYC